MVVSTIFFVFTPWVGEMIQFDLRIFFRWVGEKPPTSIFVGCQGSLCRIICTLHIYLYICIFPVCIKKTEHPQLCDPRLSNNDVLNNEQNTRLNHSCRWRIFGVDKNIEAKVARPKYLKHLERSTKKTKTKSF